MRSSKPLSSLEAIVLLVVRKGPRYGASIVEEVTRAADEQAHRSYIYELLGKLTDRELVHRWRAVHKNGQGPNHKVFYRITSLGRRTLSKHLAMMKRMG